jgi:prolyl-tRNA editing enzyme YbaK/EbsC (Cys-tRNA(Pro) deacylase)
VDPADSQVVCFHVNSDPLNGLSSFAKYTDCLASGARDSAESPQMKPAKHPTALRTSQLLRDAGIDTQVVEFEQPTRTSADAAAAIGCSVAEIAKSIVFRGANSGQAVVVVASGDNRISESKVSDKVGEPLARADGDFVRAATGYAIGGVPPLGYSQPVKLLLDQDLKRFEKIWAAGGTPFSVFPLQPDQLRRLTGAEWADVKQ